MSGKIICGHRRFSNSTVRTEARKAASGLQALNADGGKIATLLRNDAPCVTVTEAARLINAFSVPINWHFSGPEIAYVLQDCGARVVIAHSDLWARIAPTLPSDLVRELTVICVETPKDISVAHRGADGHTHPPEGTLDWGEFLADHPPIDASPSGVGAFPVTYTSGTTGNPKGVVRQGRIIPSKAHSYDAFFTPDIVTLLSAPLYHSAPQRFCSGTFAEDATLILPARFDAEETLALIEEYRVTTSFMVPTMATRLLRLPEATRASYDLSSLKQVVFAGAPFPKEVKAQMLDWWGPVIYEYYGSTESGAVTMATPDDLRRKPGTVGKVLPVARVEVLDDDRAPVPVGKVGEIFACRTDYPDFAYLNRPEERAAVGHDGMVTSGDVGYLDKEGYLFISDRKRDMIIAGGVNIYPAQIEAALLSFPSVLDAAVFGIPDPDLGEAVAAAIETVDNVPLNADQLRQFLSERIASYMIPRTITQEDSLPRDASGKLRKKRLRAPYWEGRGRAI